MHETICGLVYLWLKYCQFRCILAVSGGCGGSAVAFFCVEQIAFSISCLQRHKRPTSMGPCNYMLPSQLRVTAWSHPPQFSTSTLQSHNVGSIVLVKGVTYCLAGTCAFNAHASLIFQLEVG